MLTARFLLEMGIKSTILLVFADLLAVFLRRNSARPRMLVWRSTAVALLALPFLAAVAPRIGAMEMRFPGISLDVSAATTIRAAAVPSIAGAVVLVWAMAALFLLVRLIVAHWLIWRSVRKDLGEKQTRVVRSSSIAGPIAWGIMRPRVLLPAGSNAWDPEQLEMVIAHETVHVDGRDCLWQSLAHCAAALFWFHPLAWKLVARLREETEFHCDEVLLALGYRPSAYAETLLAFANAPSQFDRLCPVTVAVARRTTVGRRIQRILSMESRHRFTRLSATAAVLAFALVFPIAAMQAGKSEKVYKIGDGVTAPVPIYKESPKYTKEAKEAKIQGTVKLEVVINSDGTVGDVSVLEGIDSGLDQNAVDAVKTWTFQPATKDGKPVAAKAHIEINFRLQ